MVMLMLVTVILLITASSRQVTARYGYFVGLYDLAVAGNQQALFLLQQGLNANRTVINDLTQQRISAGDITSIAKREIFIEEAIPFLESNLLKYFTFYRTGFQRIWEVEINFFMPEERMLQDRYHATTIIISDDNGFSVTTTISKYNGAVRGYPAAVHASIIWSYQAPDTLINYLDDYTLKMVELMRVAD